MTTLTMILATYLSLDLILIGLMRMRMTEREWWEALPIMLLVGAPIFTGIIVYAMTAGAVHAIKKAIR